MSPRLHPAGLDQRVPGGYSRARQRGRFLERETRRNPHGILLIEQRVFGEHPVGGRCTARGVRTRGRPVDTAEKERSSDAVAGAHARHAAADRHDLAGAVRQWNGVAAHDAAEVLAGDHGLVAVIERGSAHAHQDLAGTRLRIGPLYLPERIDAASAGWNLIDFHPDLVDRDSLFSW